MLRVYLAVIQCFRQLHLLAVAAADMTQAQPVQTVPLGVLAAVVRRLVALVDLELLGKVLREATL
jgi:hypothetical protein